MCAGNVAMLEETLTALQEASMRAELALPAAACSCTPHVCHIAE